MDLYEWHLRFKRRLISQGVDERSAEISAAVAIVSDLHDDFKTDPEEAADTELSYWGE